MESTYVLERTSLSKEHSEDGHDVVNWVEPVSHLAKEYKKKFECFVQKILSSQINENCRQEMHHLEEIFDSLWEDHMMLLDKFQDIEGIARKELIRGHRKLEQTKALNFMDEETREIERTDLKEDSSLETGISSNNNGSTDDCCCAKSCTSSTKCAEKDHKLDEAHNEADRSRIEVNEQKTQIVILQEKMSSMAANFKDSKWALVKEVASKHDELMNLQNKIQTIENNLKEAERQTHFKEDIIKNLRNEIKLLKEKPKLSDVVSEVQNKKIKKMIQPDDEAGSGHATQPTENPKICIQANIEEKASPERPEKCTSNLTNYLVNPPEETATPTELTAIAAHQIDKILEGLNAETKNSKERENVNKDPLIPRINVLQHTLFDVYLPELRAELETEKKMVANKEETVQNLHAMVQLRSEQTEVFRTKVKELEQQLLQQKEVIGELQRAVQNCKQSECELHEKKISMLKFTVCELEENQKRFAKELQAKTVEEKLKLKMRLNSLSNQLQEVEPELQASQRLLLRAEKYSAELERDLEARHNEVTDLKEKVHKLEDETAAVKDQSETDRLQYVREINSLKEKVHRLERELNHVSELYIGLLDEAELRFAAFKLHVSHRYNKLLEKNKLSENLLKKLHEENEALAKKNHISDSHIKRLLDKETSQQEDISRRFLEVEKNHKQQHIALQNNLATCVSKSKDLEKEIATKTLRLQKYELQIEEGRRNEEQLQMQLEQRKKDLKKLCSENEEIKSSLVERDEQLMAWENGEMSELNSLEEQMMKMADENSKLKVQREALLKELQETLKIQQTLEAKLKTQTEFIAKLRMKCREGEGLHQESMANEAKLQNEMVTLKEESQRSLRLERDAKLKAQVELNTLRHQVSASEKVQSSYKELFARHCEILDELKLVDQLNSHLTELVSETEEGKRQIEIERDEMEKVLTILRKEHALLQDKFNSLQIRGANRQSPISITTDNQLAKAQRTIIQYEEEIVPNLKFRMERQNKIISALKTQVDEANLSCIRMREEANQLIDNTEEFQRGVEGSTRKRIPNPWSPCPPAAHKLWVSGSTSNFHSGPRRDSPDCYESGFQSRGTSPSPQPE